MLRSIPSAVPVLLAFLATLPACAPAPVRAGGDHAPAPQPVELEPFAHTVFGARHMLFVEHPALLRGEAARFAAHFSVLATGEPVRAGRARVVAGDTTASLEAPSRDGIFLLEPRFDSAGAFSGRIELATAEGTEAFELGELVVHAARVDAERAQAASAKPVQGNEVSFHLEQQWKVRLLVGAAGARSLARRFVVPAVVRVPEGAEAAIATPVVGRLLAPADGRIPRSGDDVAKGQVVAEIEPLLSAADVAQIEAIHHEFELEGLRAARASIEAGVKLEYARRERDRIVALRAKELSTLQELDAAERALTLALGEESAAREVKDHIDRMHSERREHEGEPPAFAPRFPLAAPIGGVLLERSGTLGEVVREGTELFRLRDTSRVWIEGRVSEYDLHRVGRESTAVATLVALPGRRLEIGPATGGMRLLPSMDSESHTAIVRAQVDNADGSLLPGMLGELEIATGRVEAAIAIPSESIVMEQGRATAYVMLGGETFQRRDLVLGVKDGPWVEVREGLAPGDRVVTHGAYLVRLAALAPAAIGHGHHH